MIRRALTAALALCAVAAVAAEPGVSNGAPMSRVEPGDEVLAADSLALSSHASTVASALDVPPIWIEALPPPPTIVTRQTKMYGTVTFDHPAHLARRVSCRECHGPGPIRKVVYTPRIGHDRCRGCHVMAARGPTSCNGCHTIPKPTELLAQGEAIAPAAAAVPAGPSRAELLAAIVPERPPASFTRSVEFGVTTLASHGDFLHGPTVHLVGHYGDDLLTYTLSMPGGTSHGRTQLLVGGGREFALSRKVRWSALGVGGLDATYDPGSVLPGAGVRLGLELAAAPWHGAVKTFSLQLTVLSDLAGSAQAGRHAGDLSFGLTFTAGLPLSRR